MQSNKINRSEESVKAEARKKARAKVAEFDERIANLKDRIITLNERVNRLDNELDQVECFHSDMIDGLSFKLGLAGAAILILIAGVLVLAAKAWGLI